MYAPHRTASFLMTATFIAGLALALPNMAHAEPKKIPISYDTAISNCFGTLALADPEITKKMYDGQGFVWNNDRDALISDCMAKYGFKMAGPKSMRVGSGGGGGRDIPPDAIRNRFREDMIRYGGEQALAAIDAGADTTFIPKAVLRQAGKLKDAPAAGSAANFGGGTPQQGGGVSPTIGQIPMPAPAPVPSTPVPEPVVTPVPDEPAAPASVAKPARPAPATPTGGGTPIFIPH